MDNIVACYLFFLVWNINRQRGEGIVYAISCNLVAILILGRRVFPRLLLVLWSYQSAGLVNFAEIMYSLLLLLGMVSWEQCLSLAMQAILLILFSAVSCAYLHTCISTHTYYIHMPTLIFLLQDPSQAFLLLVDIKTSYGGLKMSRLMEAWAVGCNFLRKLKKKIKVFSSD